MKLYAVVAVYSEMVIEGETFPCPVVVTKPYALGHDDIPNVPAVYTSIGAARRFIKTLPSDCEYKIVMFDSGVKCNVVRRFRWWDLVCAMCRLAALEKTK